MNSIEVSLADGRTEWFQSQNFDEHYETSMNEDGSLTVYHVVDGEEGPQTTTAAQFAKDEWKHVVDNS